MKNYSKNIDNVINYEVMGGWPITKMNVRDIIQGFGATFNKETSKWEIEESNLLDIFPRKLNDDGMGYGVNEEYIIEASIFSDSAGNHYCNIFTESELENLEVWKKYNIFPGLTFKIGDNEYYIFAIEKRDDNYIFLFRNEDDHREILELSEEEAKSIILEQKRF